MFLKSQGRQIGGWEKKIKNSNSQSGHRLNNRRVTFYSQHECSYFTLGFLESDDVCSLSF